jgi:RND family efflux transporter MFP subunit
MNKQFIITALKGLLLALLASTAMASGVPEMDCLIEPHLVVDVNSSVVGKIETIAVEKSNLVEKGQTLVELESDVERATVELAKARVEMDAELRTHKTSYAFAKRKLTRFDDLFRDEVVPLHKKDEVETEANLAALQIRQAKENQRLAELEYERAVVLLEQRTVRSPITGVVVDRFKAPGEFAQDEPILRLAQLDPLNVEVIVPASFFGQIQTGMKANVIPEAPKDGNYSAEVTIVDRVVDASSGTFGVRLELPNPDYKLPGGLKCRVSFQTDGANMQSGTEPSSKLAAQR